MPIQLPNDAEAVGYKETTPYHHEQVFRSESAAFTGTEREFVRAGHGYEYDQTTPHTRSSIRVSTCEGGIVSNLYGYYINLDERGDFNADVRNTDGETVFEIRAGRSLDEDESSIFEDGFMQHKEDLSGLTEYLRSLGVIAQEATVLTESEFEQRLDVLDDDDEHTSSPHP